MSLQLEQLILAARTVTKKTPRKRVRNLLNKLMQEQLRQGKYNQHLATIIYYLSIGTVSQSLWENG